MNTKRVCKSSRVKIHCHGRTLDNEYLLSTRKQKPIEFTIGKGSVPNGLEEKIIGMAAGEKKMITLLPEEGFGQRSSALVSIFDQSDFPQESSPEIGRRYRIRFPDGRITRAHVTAIEGPRITLDANHPLAGRTVKFEIEMVEVSESDSHGDA